MLLAVDLPLCAVADTLLLPRTLAAQRARRAAVPVPAPAVGPAQPGNAFSDLVDNEFTWPTWLSYPRLSVPVQAEAAPLPKTVER